MVPRFAEGELIESLAAQFRQRPGVYSVETGRQQVDAIREWFNSFRWIVLLMSIVLAAASALLIFNMIRVAMFARRREIEVMKLVGATNSFIRLPFILEGMLHGLAEALLVLSPQVSCATTLKNFLVGQKFWRSFAPSP